MRQIPFEQLYKNLPEPLPIRIIGRTEMDIRDHRRKTLQVVGSTEEMLVGMSAQKVYDGTIKCLRLLPVGRMA